MQCLNIMKASALRLSGASPIKPHINVLCGRFSSNFNRKSTSRFTPVDKKPCLDLRNVSIIRYSDCYASLIPVFLNNHYWPREPSVIALWMSLDSPYLEFLTAKYCHSGERLLAMEYYPCARVSKMIGLSVANRVYPWMIDELEQLGHITESPPERHRMYFYAHCLRSPNLFQKYKVDYIYDIEVLGTSADVARHGVGTLLLKTALNSAYEMRHPLVQVVAISNYAAKICEKCGMKRVWSMNYRDYIDNCGKSVFYPRAPHHKVAVYVKYFEPSKGGELPCKPHF